MTGARFGALGVLNEDRTGLAEFITVGLGPEEVARIGALPTGKGCSECSSPNRFLYVSLASTLIPRATDSRPDTRQ